MIKKKSQLTLFVFGLFFFGYGILQSISTDPNHNFSGSAFEVLIKIISPLIASILIFGIYKALENYQLLKSFLAYLLFFSISIASFFGLTSVLTGSHAVSTNPYIYGLSFYTAYFAFQIINKNINFYSTYIAANPLLLFTGPIAVIFSSLSHQSFVNRLNYFLPFFVVGLFFFKVVAVPLTNFFWMLDITSSIEVFIFGVIFELFIYFNFCGLSLIIYSIFGVFGVRIPLNFKQPFSSKNVIEFWRGWHRSLSSVLRVLFYLPTKKYFSTPIALFAVYISSAMWHGVTVNFFIWGAFHAICFICTIKLLKSNFVKTSTFLMFFAIIYGRVLFADSNTQRLFEKFIPDIGEPMQTLDMLISMTPLSSFIALAFAMSVVMSEFLFQDTKYFKKRNYKFLRLKYPQFFLVIIFILLIGSSTGIDYAAYGQR